MSAISADLALKNILRGYPERDDTFGSVAGRIAHAWITRLRCMRDSGHANPAEYLLKIQRGREALAAHSIVSAVAQLRYRLRRDGYTDALIVECLALVTEALARSGIPGPSPVAYVAAAEQLRRRIAAVTDSEERVAALALAAVAAGLSGQPVHVLARNDARAVELARAIDAYGGALSLRTTAVVAGMDLGLRREAYTANVVCATVHTVGLDYLRDRLQLGARRSRLANIAVRLSGDAPADELLMLRGLYCALVDDADLVLIDDARIPLVIAADADLSHERLLYEQAVELARALESERDFVVIEGEPVLTDDGRERLAVLVSPLGGIWAARTRCEELIGIALRALHEFQRDRDYRIVRGRVIFPAAAGKEHEERTEGDDVLQKCTEVKEGCQLSGRREVLARISAPRFLNRYLWLGGACASATPIRREVLSLYGVAVTDQFSAAEPVACEARVFTSEQARVAAVRRYVDAAHAAGNALVLAMRSPTAADSVKEELTRAGIQVELVAGRQGDEGRGWPDGLAQPGSVAMVIFPAGWDIAYSQSVTPVRLLLLELQDSQRHVERLCRIFAVRRCEMLLALDDEVINALMPQIAKNWAARHADRTGELPAHWSQRLSAYFWWSMEREQRLLREELRSRDVYLGEFLAFGGRHD